MLNLKGKKYVLVEWPDSQIIIDYLSENKTEIFEECYAVDETVWFIPVDALDHLNIRK